MAQHNGMERKTRTNCCVLRSLCMHFQHTINIDNKHQQQRKIKEKGTAKANPVHWTHDKATHKRFGKW